MLTVDNLNVSVSDDKKILNACSFHVNAGELHVIMGPNGAGKTTLAHVLSGRDGYEVTSGSASFQGDNLLDWSIQERAWKGIFLGMQYPVEIPGVNNLVFLKAALNQIRKSKGQEPLDAIDFMDMAKETLKQMGMDTSWLKREVNAGFSGGEKKRNEIFQLLMLDPKLAILDETDSGLDIDALQVVASGINAFRRPDKALILITHYQRLLNYVQPDFIHVMKAGRIVKTGTAALALELEEKGYGWLEND